MGSKLISNQIEYNIYTFDLPKDGKISQMNKWKKYTSLPCQKSAIKQAIKLGNTKKFYKIEVKKKYKDLKNNKTINKTIKTINYNDDIKFNNKILLTSIILIGIIIFMNSYI